MTENIPQTSRASRITRIDLFSVFLRSFYLEAAWNFHQMQNFGFLYSMIPVIKKLYPDRPGRVRALKRHLQFFNTHPYFASLILGVAINLEEKKAAGSGVDAMDIVNFKDTLMSPLAALGDSLFWATWRPFTALIGTGFVFISFIDNRPFEVALIGPLLLLVLFNLPHFYLRWEGLISGYRNGTAVIKKLQQINWQKWIERIRWTGLIITVIIIAHFVSVEKSSLLKMPSVTDLVFLSSVILFALGLKIRISPTILFFILITVCILLNYAGV